jgi:adenylosuccinate lyase
MARRRSEAAGLARSRGRRPVPCGAGTRVTPDESLAVDNVLATRYASPEMSRIWSPHNRYGTWRRIWLALAEAQQKLGLPIRDEQLAQMRAALDQIDFAAVARHEQRTRHDVMAHIHAFAEAAPAARPILHLGATSMDIVDNADLILLRQAIDLLLARLAAAAAKLADFCEQHADLPTLGYTHLQPAQLTTVGKRAALWLADLCADLERLSELRGGLRCRGLRGATGTQASFLALLGSEEKVQRLEREFAARLGFEGCYPVCGQTYSRKVDVQIIQALESFAAGVHKLCNDIRLLAMQREIEEPFEQTQVGSSAMPYKRNPALCERATGLARYLLSLASSPPMTLAAQMLERTLDDSSNKRLVLPATFLTADAIAVLLQHIFNGLVVYPATIAAHVRAELPFIATEEILAAAVARGGDRQALHERLRRHSQAAAQQIKQHGRPNDLIERLKGDARFREVAWDKLLDPRSFIGLAPQQTRRFLREHVRPLLKRMPPPLPPADLCV